jgi:hypothetical protein
MKALGIEGSMFEIQSKAFAQARPTMRAKMWHDLEIVRRELAKQGIQDIPQARKEAQAKPDHDAETTRYKTALEEAGKTAVEVNGLVTLFSISNAQIRQVLWDQLGGSQ